MGLKEKITEEKLEKKELTKEQREFLVKHFEDVQHLGDRIFYFNKWVTNVSLGLLGFLIAFLLQLKFSGIEIVSYSTIIPFVTLIIAILIGMGLKFWNELIEFLQKFYWFRRDYINNFELTDEDYEDIIPISDNLKDYILGAKIDHLPIFWMGTQIFFFIISLIGISIYITKVLFL